MRFYLFILFALSALGINLSTAQNTVIRNFGVDKGLPSSECYWSIEDSKGYIWICSDAGVVKYDGYNFITYNSSKGLPDNTVFKVTEDKKGRIWFASFSGKLSYYDYAIDSIICVPANDQLIKYISTAPISINFDAKDTLWLSIYRKGIVKVIPPLYSSFQTIRSDCTSFFIQQIGKNKYIEACDHSEIRDVSPMFFNSITQEKKLIGRMSTNMVHLSITEMVNGIAFFSNGKGIYKFDGQSITRVLSDEIFEINSVYLDKNGQLWVATGSRGLLLFDLNTTPSLINVFLPNESISSVNIDRNNGIWITSTSNGLFFIPSIDIKSFASHKTHYSHKINNRLYANDNDGNLCSFSTGDVLEYKKQFGHAWNIYPYDSSLVVMSAPSYLLDLKNGNKTTIYDDENERLNLVSVADYNDSTLIGADNIYDYLIEINKRNGKFSVLAKNTPRVFDIEMVKNTAYIATNTGLFKYNENGFTKLNFSGNKLNGRITSVEHFGKLILVSSNSHGVFAIDEKEQIVKELNESNGLVSNVCKMLLVDKYGFLWVGTNKGLVCYNLNNPSFIECYRASNKGGLLSNEINNMSIDGDTIYVSTNSGINYFNVNVVNKTLNVPVHVESVLLNGKLLQHNGSIELEYNQNNIIMNYKALLPSKNDELVYKYKLEGLDSAWNYTTNTFIQYAALSPGDYTFSVSINTYGKMLANTAEIRFTIKKPFWLRWWFILFEIILTIGILYLIGKLVVVYVRRKEARKNKIERTIIESELKALRAQMNPHFIFNSLNSIQSFILKNETKNAQKYLSKFSKLIRAVLENSRNESILLSDELDMLQLYLELEQLRADFSFDYKVEIDPILRGKAIQIPSMLIQPYIENAILHGVLPLTSGKGLIQLKIYEAEGCLLFEIDDNGIGREEALKIRQKKNLKKTSLGTLVTEERIENINRFGAFKIQFKTEDKMEMNKALGTKVTLKIKQVI